MRVSMSFLRDLESLDAETKLRSRLRNTANEDVRSAIESAQKKHRRLRSEKWDRRT